MLPDQAPDPRRAARARICGAARELACSAGPRRLAAYRYSVPCGRRLFCPVLRTQSVFGSDDCRCRARRAGFSGAAAEPAAESPAAGSRPRRSLRSGYAQVRHARLWLPRSRRGLQARTRAATWSRRPEREATACGTVRLFRRRPRPASISARPALLHARHIRGLRRDSRLGTASGSAAYRASGGIAPAAAGRARCSCGRCRARTTAASDPPSRIIVPGWLNKSARYAVVWDIQERATKTTWTTTPTSAIQTTTSTPERTNPPLFFKRMRHLRVCTHPSHA